jgi:hypothetical protein
MGAASELTAPAPPAGPQREAGPFVVLASELGGAGGGLAATAAVAVASALGHGRERVLLAEVSDRERRAPTLLASAGARELEATLRERGLAGAAARGRVCWLPLPQADGLDPLAGALAAEARAELAFAFVPPALWTAALDRPDIAARAGLLRAVLPAQRSLAALAVGELRERGMRARVASRPLGRVGTRRSLAGIDPGGDASRRARRLARGLIGSLAGERGQALPLTLGGAFLVIFAALLFALLAGAVTGAAATQRAADLAALSGARSMRDDLPRLLAPATLPNGAPNPAHMRRAEYFARAEAAARDAADRNGAAARRVAVEFPDRSATPPVRIGVAVRAELDRDLEVQRARGRPAGGRALGYEARAEAEASPPASFTGMPETASGGGYSGPLAYRQGEPMRPDVAAAFDRMAAAARRAGHSLAINSAFRSDAEQARLFAANPDPRMVAPPGRSLHRCATELDLGPASAYGWLAAHAGRFGFVKRYSWEPWHFGYAAGPAPCSAAGDSVGSRGSADGEGASGGLPSFVPSRYRPMIERSAARWKVSGALLAAQIEAESGFNPNAVSPAGARGIAQFMPATAASYGLRNPMDPRAAIDAQAHMMSDLLRQFRSVPLALAAYNAGPGAVAACHCVPPYPETRAYVARILALLDGAGAMLVPELEVRLVA